MSPQAQGAVVEYHYDDHDTDVVDESPPVQNTWYVVFDAVDVRCIWCTIFQTNDEAAGKACEVRWTIDGTVYFWGGVLANATTLYLYRDHNASTGGTAGLSTSTSARNAALYTDKRGKAFKIEVRITAALGTNQRLVSQCVRETQDIT